MEKWEYLVVLASVWAILAVSGIAFFALSWQTGFVIEEDYSKLDTIDIEEESKYSDYTWKKMPISYYYDDSCAFREDRIKKAVKEIEKLTSGKVNFLKVNDKEDLRIICDILPRDEKEQDYLGKAVVKYDPEKKSILSATVFFYGQPTDKCSYPDVEIHELMHSLGQGHSNIKGSIMMPMQFDCIDKIHLENDFEIFDNLGDVYWLKG